MATAAAGIPIVLGLIIVGGPLYTVVVAALVAVGTYEITRAAGMNARDPLAIAGVTAAGALAIAARTGPDAQLLILVLLVAGSLAAAVYRADVAGGFQRWSAAVAGAVYVGLLGSTLVSLRFLPDGRGWVLAMLFTTFATDTGAFFIGRAFGRRKLAPHVSPGKTIAGAVGGLAAGALASVALGLLLGLSPTPAAMAALGALLAVAGQLGDLAESLIKRSLGVKDMGHLFPGHGGVLDRLDSILFTAPLAYYAVRWVLS